MKKLKPASASLCFFGLSIMGLSLFSPWALNEVYARNGLSLVFQETGVSDSNPLMRSDSESNDVILGVETTASIVFDHNSSSQDFSTKLSVKRNQFNISDYNSTDFFLALNTKRKIGRWLFGFDGSVDYDTPRTADESTLGQSTLSDRRFAFSISPSFVYRLSPRKSFGLNTSWARKNYSDDSTLTSHQTQTVSPFFSLMLTRKDTTSIAWQYQHYESLDEPSLDVNSVGPFVTWKRQISPKTSLEASLGLLGTRYSGVGQAGGWEVNPIYSLKLEYTGQRNTASIGINRARQALTNGTETDITSAQIKNEYAILPTWYLNFQADYELAKQSELSTDDLDRSYGGSVGTQYDISKEMQFTMSYKYMKENYVSDRDPATRNVLRASLDYKLK